MKFKFLIIILILLSISGCSKSDKIEQLEQALQQEKYKNGQLWSDRVELRYQLSSVKEKLNDLTTTV